MAVESASHIFPHLEKGDDCCHARVDSVPVPRAGRAAGTAARGLAAARPGGSRRRAKRFCPRPLRWTAAPCAWGRSCLAPLDPEVSRTERYGPNPLEQRHYLRAVCVSRYGM